MGSGRFAAAAFAAAVAVAFAAFLSPADAVLLIPVLTALLFVSLRLREHSALQGAAILTAVIAVSAAAADAVRAWLAGSTLLQERTAMVESALEMAGTVAGVDGDALAGLDSEILVDLMVRVWAVDYLTMGLLTAVLGVAVAGWASARVGTPVRRLPALSELDLSPHILWPFVGGLLLLAVGRMTGDTTGLAWIAGLNLLLAVRLPLFVQGLGVASALYRRVGLGRLARVIGYALLAVVELLVPVLSLVGLVDFWANFRKLPREDSRTSGGGDSESRSENGQHES